MNHSCALQQYLYLCSRENDLFACSRWNNIVSSPSFIGAFLFVIRICTVMAVHRCIYHDNIRVISSSMRILKFTSHALTRGRESAKRVLKQCRKVRLTVFILEMSMLICCV